jgi:dolichol-phosphate mannosyltransferase
MKSAEANPQISVVSPVYGAPDALEELCSRLRDTLSALCDSFEIILVNDASPDRSWEIIRLLATADPRVKGINLSRNFGQHYAITAGLDHARGDWVVVMDCDLQDQPEEISKLYNKALEGVDVVVGKRYSRKEGAFRKLASRAFYAVYDYFADQRTDCAIASFGVYSRRAIDSINRLREQNRSFGLAAIWIGFPRVEVNVEHAPRKSGRSSYTLKKLLALAFDSVVSHSNKPLKVSVGIGLFLAIASVLYSLWLVIRHLIWAVPVEGWTSLIVSLYFLSGLIIGSIGMVGLYVGKVFDQVKGRPKYIIESSTFDRCSND